MEVCQVTLHEGSGFQLYRDPAGPSDTSTNCLAYFMGKYRDAAAEYLNAHFDLGQHACCGHAMG